MRAALDEVKSQLLGPLHHLGKVGVRARVRVRVRLTLPLPLPLT